jgi:hypothetical protein
MKIKMSVVVGAVVAMLGSSVFAAECPVDTRVDDFFSDVSQAIEDAYSCSNAAEIAGSCGEANGTGADFANKAIVKCQSMQTGLTSEQTHDLELLKQKCQDHYASFKGSMFLAFAANCKLSAHVVYDHFSRWTVVEVDDGELEESPEEESAPQSK